MPVREALLKVTFSQSEFKKRYGNNEDILNAEMGTIMI